MEANDMKSEPLGCPFCGHSADLGIGRGAEDAEGYPTYIYCAACGCQGPWFYTRESAAWTTTSICAAMSGWNERRGRAS